MSGKINFNTTNNTYNAPPEEDEDYSSGIIDGVNIIACLASEWFSSSPPPPAIPPKGIEVPPEVDPNSPHFNPHNECVQTSGDKKFGTEGLSPKDLEKPNSSGEAKPVACIIQ